MLDSGTEGVCNILRRVFLANFPKSIDRLSPTRKSTRQFLKTLYRIHLDKTSFYTNPVLTKCREEQTYATSVVKDDGEDKMLSLKLKAINEERRPGARQASNGLKEKTRNSATEALKEVTEGIE